MSRKRVSAGRGVRAGLLAAGLALGAAAQDWIPLFDGQSLAGWRAAENPASFRVENGAILCDGPRAHLYYAGRDGQASFTNFEFQAEVMTRPGANSGVYFHTAFQETGFPGKGFEAQLCSSPRAAANYRENKLTGSLYGLRNVYKAMAPDNEWFTLRIMVRGKQVQIRVNDLLLADYVEPQTPPAIANRPGRKLAAGTFALQCHDPESKVYFRNLKARHLPAGQASPAGKAEFDDYEKEIIRLGVANYPLVNFHVHLKGGLTLAEALEESRRTGIFYGVAVNCGVGFPVTNDAGIYQYLESMKGQPVFVGMQAEGREWVRMFSRAAIGRFDYVFTDAMTIVDDQGRRMRLWLKDETPAIKDPEAFMEMLVDRTVKILENEPIDIYVNPTYLPAQLAGDYDRLWTEARMGRVARAAAARKIAVEINGKARLPSPAFLKLAKAAGCQFAFGTNNTDRDIGRLDYCLQMVKDLGLKPADFWLPPAEGPRAGRPSQP